MGFSLATAEGFFANMERRLVILGIETSVENVGVALGDHNGIRATASISSDRKHAESLTPMIQFVMQQAESSMSDISAIAVDIGPGLFTGMRVGIATAQSLAWALEVPVIPVCSLDALAQTVAWSDSPIVASLDARRGEVYWALYRARGQELQRIVEPTVTSPDDLAIHIADRAEEVVCVGTGFKRYADTFEANPWGQIIGGDSLYPTASAVVTLGASALLNDSTVAPDNVEPMYLRVPDAEINWKTREATP